MNPLAIKLAGIAISFAGVFYGGMWVKQAQWDAAKLSESEAVKRADESVAKHIKQIRIEHVEITKPIVKTVREVTVYRECVHDDSVLDGINKALAGSQ